MSFALGSILAGADDPSFDGSSPDESSLELLRPIVAGARAGGVADAFELMGVGAALIDATGAVLHIGGRGRRMLGGWVRIVSSHLVAERDDDNAALQDLIGTAIVSVECETIRLDRADGAALTIRALPFPEGGKAGQLLRAVLVFEEVARL